MLKRNTLLWVVQVLLAALFLFAGGFKLVAPIAAMKGPVDLPGWFLRFVGTAEVFGAIGLIVPWLTGIRRELTALAALGLVIIMSGATMLTVVGMGVAPAVFPAIVGALALTIAVGRQTTAERESATIDRQPSCAALVR